MAGNLVKGGYQVRGFDLSQAARDGAAMRGVTPFDDLTAAVTGADAVISMLPNGALVKKVWRQFAEVVVPGAVMIDSSTIDVGSAIAAHEMPTDRGCLTLDAPVSGGTGGAEAGTLTFMVDGAEQALAKGIPFLQPMAGRVAPCGGAGAGQAANNGYKPGFATAPMLKDVRLSQEAALSRGAQTPLGAEAAQLYGLFEAQGHGGADFSGIITFLRGART